MVSHLDSFWHRGKPELGNGLLKMAAYLIESLPKYVYFPQQSREIAKLTSDLRELKQNNEDLKQKVKISDVSFQMFIAQC